ncbi:uncharacterized protein LOC135170235 isoform X1 [Diachasmimorpha longicaudata]|uniref:uncharacterized protein LOC135170235 isoform X1 n=1 Tax=Diachasmimorpha longicaudata TaxID=58733 RepID=UPI0030B8D403
MRRHVLVEEVPGLYIRRLTLEDPRIARDRVDRPDSRSPSPVRHICHPRSADARPGRGSSSSCRFWLQRVKNEKPAYLTITSLELPDCPIPLIESQASGRWRCAESPRNPGKDEILDELIDSVSKVARPRKNVKSADQSISKAIQRSRRQFIDSPECQSTLGSLEACTKSISGGPPRAIIANSSESIKDCICSEFTENLQINIREETEVKPPSSRSPSPEVTHTIRIAMKYLGQSQRRPEEAIGNDGTRTPEDTPSDTKSDDSKEGSECSVNVALDFTLNCCSVQLTSRDITLKPASIEAQNST